MVTKRQHADIRRVRPWWRPLAWSAVTAAAIAALFQPVPALAAPAAPVAAPAVPDSGSRPIPLGTLTMPGQTTALPTTPATGMPAGLTQSPLVAKIEKRRADIAVLGDKLIKLGQDRDLARQQVTTAEQKVAAAQSAVALAQQAVTTAAAGAMRDAAALPPGTIGSELQDLDSLAAIQRGEAPDEEAAARQLSIAQAAQQAALTEQTTATASVTTLSAGYDKLNATIAKKQSELQKLEQRNNAALTAAEAQESAEDAQLGDQYLAGANAGRGADPRAVAALQFALSQRGDPYVWSEEGPNQWDCSGLMFGAYRSTAAGSFPLMRVSRDQYWQTRNKVVDRYSLLPGDLLFFSSSMSWTGIHHVAMYAGDGMMVEAPRTGLNVRLVPVRWSRLFQATRIYGSVDGETEGPVLGKPDPESTSPTPTTKPTSKPPNKPTKPAPKPTKSTTPSPSQSKPSPSASTSQPTQSTPSASPSSPTPSLSPSAEQGTTTGAAGNASSPGTGKESSGSASASD